MPKLVHSRDGVVVKEYVLETGLYTIGRRPNCDIQIDDVTVSGQHAIVSVALSEYMEGVYDIHIEDQGSTNGTIVNGRRIKKHLFKHGQVAQIGTHDLTLIDEGTRAFEETEVLLPDQKES